MRDRLIWLGALAYAALFTWLGAIKYAAHRNLVDFGIFAQTTASAFGCFCNPIEGSHWAFHFSPILYVAGAAVALAHSPLTLIALQAIAGALTVPPIYGIVERHADRTIARWAALVAFLYPALAGLVFNDFHENGFAPAAVAWMVWAFDGGYMRLTVVFAAIALAVKEDQAVFLTIAGLLAAWRFRGTTPGRYALGIALASAIVIPVFFKDIQPHAAANPLWQPERFYAWTPDDWHGLFPRGIAERLGFFVLAFLPLLFLPFCSRVMWLAAAPLAEVLLSRMSTTYTMGSHYAGAWIGYVLAAFAFAVRRLPESTARRLLPWCVALCAVELLVANPLHPGLNLRRVEQRDIALNAELHELPEGVSIATQEEAYTHLALGNPFARLLPEDGTIETRACFVLIDRDFPDSPRLQEYSAALHALVARGVYVPSHRSDGIELYHRVGSCR